MFVFVKIWLEGGKVSASLFQCCFSATAHWSSLCGWFMFPLREYDCCNNPHYQAPPLGAMWDGWSEDSIAADGIPIEHARIFDQRIVPRILAGYLSWIWNPGLNICPWFLSLLRDQMAYKILLYWHYDRKGRGYNQAMNHLFDKGISNMY